MQKKNDCCDCGSTQALPTRGPMLRWGPVPSATIAMHKGGDTSRPDLAWESTRRAQAVIHARCQGCHPLADSPSDNQGRNPWSEGWMNQLAGGRSGRWLPEFRYDRHAIFNLSRPELSLVLLAPLSREAGGMQICRPDGGNTGCQPRYARGHPVGMTFRPSSPRLTSRTISHCWPPCTTRNAISSRSDDSTCRASGRARNTCARCGDMVCCRRARWIRSIRSTFTNSTRPTGSSSSEHILPPHPTR